MDSKKDLKKAIFDFLHADDKKALVKNLREEDDKYVDSDEDDDNSHDGNWYKKQKAYWDG